MLVLKCVSCGKQVGKFYALEMCYNCYIKDYQQKNREASSVKP